jgi:hypothetical protein
MANRIALEYGVPTTTLFNLVEYESKWNPKADNGFDRGLVQINRASWPDITDEQAFDPEFSLRFAAEKIKNDEQHLWVVCNCYLLAEVLTDYKLPRMIDIIPNEIYPKVGGLVILRYTNNKHIVVVTKVTEEGIWIREANFKPCALGSRLLSWQDPHIKGYYSPQGG